MIVVVASVIIIIIISQPEVVAASAAHRLFVSHVITSSTSFIPTSSRCGFGGRRLERCISKGLPISERVENGRLTTGRRASPSSSPSAQRTSPSPWSPGKWKITFDFGLGEQQQQTPFGGSDVESNENSIAQQRRYRENLLGANWGADGSRLILSLDVIISSETTSSYSNDYSATRQSVEERWLGGKPTGSIQCVPKQQRSSDGDYDDDQIYHASYVNNKGEQRVRIMSGQWRHEPPTPLLPTYTNTLPGQASSLRLHIKLINSIERNTISFPDNQILLLQSNTFRISQFTSGIQTLLPYQYAKEQSQLVLEVQLNHETGDRRLDGSDVFETIGGYRDIAALVMERDERRRQWKEVQGVLPKMTTMTMAGSSSGSRSSETMIEKLLNDEKRWGVWPGDTELMTVERGVVLAAVSAREKKQSMFPWMTNESNVKELVVVGKWSATSLTS